jgi:hypothetical protein
VSATREPCDTPRGLRASPFSEMETGAAVGVSANPPWWRLAFPFCFGEQRVRIQPSQTASRDDCADTHFGNLPRHRRCYRGRENSRHRPGWRQRCYRRPRREPPPVSKERPFSSARQVLAPPDDSLILGRVCPHLGALATSTTLSWPGATERRSRSRPGRRGLFRGASLRAVSRRRRPRLFWLAGRGHGLALSQQRQRFEDEIAKVDLVLRPRRRRYAALSHCRAASREDSRLKE